MQDLKGKIKVAASAAAGALMLGSTLAGAFAADLSNLPSPFVVDHNMVGQVVVGANAAVPDVIAAAQLTAAFGEYLVSAESSGSTTTASGGRLEEILMGKALTFTGQFPATLKNNHISTLKQGEVTFKSNQFDYREELVLSSGAEIVTGQDDRDKDYDTTEPFLSLAKGAVMYKYNFYGSSKPLVNETTTSDPLELSILGHDVKITSATLADQITAEVGTKVSLKTDESSTIEGKTVLVTAIGQNSVLVSVDGVTSGEPISDTDADGVLVNGLRVKVTGLIYQSNTPESSLVSLLVGKDDVSEAYDNGEAFIGEDKNDPTWTWVVDINGATGELNSLGVKNEKAWDNYKDSPTTVGESFMLPNDYAKIDLQSMSPAADRIYTLEFDTGVSLYDTTGANELFANAKIIRLSTVSDTGFTDATNDAADIALYFWTDAYAGNSTDDVISVFYKDSSKYKFAQNLTFAGGASAAETIQSNWYLQYGDSLPYIAVENNGADIGIHVKLDTITGATDVNSTVVVNTTVVGGAFDHLGPTAAQSDAADVYIDDVDRIAVGSFDGSLLTHYGAILSSVKSNTDSDEVVIKLPDAQTKIKAFIGGVSGSTSTVAGDVTYMMTALNSEVAVLDSEADTSAPLVVVGGPYANAIASQLIGSDDTVIKDFFGYDGTSGKGVVKLYDAADTPFSAEAMVVAGWDAKDTRAAAHMLGKYITGAKDLSGLSGLDERKVTASSATSYVEE